MKLQTVLEWDTSDPEIAADLAKIQRAIQKLRPNSRIGNNPKKNDLVDFMDDMGVINSISKGYAYVKFENRPGEFTPLPLSDFKPGKDHKFWKAW
ncbi:MAG: hypothetical protein AABY22_05295 [Nanoarchaeota archaeon]